jgi:hypothetical protein
MYVRLTKRERKKMIQRKRHRALLSELHAPTLRELSELAAKNVPEEPPAVPFGVFDEPHKILPISCYLTEHFGSSEEFGSDREGRRRGEKLQGRVTDWSDDALVETAAVWATKHHNRDCKGNAIPPKSVTPHIIGTAQLTARDAYVSPHPYYRITDRMIDSLWPDDPFTYRDVEMKLVPDNKLNQLTCAYIAAVEKARRGISVKEPKRVILKQEIFEREHAHPKDPGSKLIVERMLAQLPQKIGREPTLEEKKRAKQAYQKLVKGTSPVVCSTLTTDLKSTDAECDEIELWVCESGKKWLDSRKLAIRSVKKLW